jgi:hypothetical protein
LNKDLVSPWVGDGLADAAELLNIHALDCVG